MARDENFSLFLLLPLTMAVLGMLWLALNDIKAGENYSLLFLGGVALTVLLYLLIDEHSKASIVKLIKLPFFSKPGYSVLSYVIGLLLPFLLFTLFSLNTSAVAIPLAADTINSQIATQFAALEIQNSPFWQVFTTVFTAGTIEEFAFAIVTMILGAALTSLLLTLFMVNLRGSARRWVLFFGGLVLSFGAFMFIHQLNDTYTVARMFVVAGVFRVLMNGAVYLGGLMLSFAVGFHQSNNAIYYISTFGWPQFWEALRGGGYVIPVYLLVVVLALLANIGGFGAYLSRVRARRLR